MTRTIFPVILLWMYSGIAFCQTNSQGVPLDTTYTVSSTYWKLVKKYPFIKPVYPSAPEGVRQKKDLVYKTIKDSPFGKRDLHADVYIPAGKKRSYPALVLVHGGGWRAGDKSLNTAMAEQIALSGYVVISVEYRLSLEAKYPAGVHDVKACIRWIRENARDLEVDPARIAIGGSSAGGQLSSLVGATNGNAQFEGPGFNPHVSSSVQAVINMDGLLDFTNEQIVSIQHRPNNADAAWLGGLYDDVPETWKEASALTWVNKNSPPFLFINSSQTRFHAGCAEMVAKLNAFNIYSKVIKFEDAPHSYWLFHPWFNPTVEHIVDFMDKILKP